MLYDSLASNVVCVVVDEPSVRVLSNVSWTDGCSSYPDRETFALDSKNCFQNLDPSHTSRECSAYCSTMGKMLEVTMRWARLKLWSISWRVRVMDCSSFSSSSVNVKEFRRDMVIKKACRNTLPHGLLSSSCWAMPHAQYFETLHSNDWSIASGVNLRVLLSQKSWHIIRTRSK